MFRANNPQRFRSKAFVSPRALAQPGTRSTDSPRAYTLFTFECKPFPARPSVRSSLGLRSNELYLAHRAVLPVGPTNLLPPRLSKQQQHIAEYRELSCTCTFTHTHSHICIHMSIDRYVYIYLTPSFPHLDRVLHGEFPWNQKQYLPRVVGTRASRITRLSSTVPSPGRAHTRLQSRTSGSVCVHVCTIPVASGIEQSQGELAWRDALRASSIRPTAPVRSTPNNPFPHPLRLTRDLRHGHPQTACSASSPDETHSSVHTTLPAPPSHPPRDPAPLSQTAFLSDYLPLSLDSGPLQSRVVVSR